MIPDMQYIVIMNITIAAKFKDMKCPDLNLSTDLIKKNFCMPVFNDWNNTF